MTRDDKRTTRPTIFVYWVIKWSILDCTMQYFSNKFMTIMSQKLKLKNN